MAENLWQTLLDDAHLVTTVEQPITQPEPTIQIPVQQLPNSLQVDLTQTFSDIEEEEEEEDEGAGELDIIDTPSNNTFDLNIPRVNTKPVTNFDLGLGLNINPSQQMTNVAPLQPRKPGRPPKVQTAAAVVNELNQTPDLSKSSINTPQSVQAINQSGTDKTVTISKATLKAIGESLQRIATAIIEESK